MIGRWCGACPRQKFGKDRIEDEKFSRGTRA